MSFKEIFKIFLSWRLFLLLIAIPAMFYVPARTRFTHLTEAPSFQNLSSMWSNFDGLHYLDLAEFGYGYQNKTEMDYVFFPVYPLLIKSLNVFQNYLVSGLFISHLSFFLALYFLYRLFIFDVKPKIARNTLYLILLFPASFYFGSVYTESLFLLLTVLVFYFARKYQFLLASLVALVASATRITGIFLWPALIYEFWLFAEKDIKKIFNPSLVWLALPPIGLLAYMKFQYLKVGDAFFFITSQANFASRTTEKLVLLHQVFYRYFKMMIFVDHLDPLFFTVLIEFLSGLLLLLVIIFAFKTMRKSYWLFITLSYILPSLTGTFLSMPRFTIVLFPVFLYLSQFFESHHPYLKYSYYLICSVLSIFAVIFFTRGYFVG